MVRLSRKYPIQEVHFNHIIPYPGTELFGWIEENNLFLRQPEEFLSEASWWERPVFETPELSERERIDLFSYLVGVRKEVHRDAVFRIFGRHRTLGWLASAVVANRLFERWYYKSGFLRNIIERFRYTLSRKS